MGDETPEVIYPHVSRLYYVVSSTPSYRLADDVSFVGDLDGFRAEVSRHVAEFIPTRHFGTEAKARAALEPQLQAWEVSAAMMHMPGVIEFRFRHVRVRERPPEPGQLEGVVAMAFAGDLTAHVTIANVPTPPVGFAVDPMVRALAGFYLFARRTPDVLLHMAYAMTTCIEHHHETLTKAATALKVSRPVFEKLNDLASTRGEGVQIRKFEKNSEPTPLTVSEREWVERILKVIVERAGAVAAGVENLSEINMGTHPLT